MAGKVVVSTLNNDTGVLATQNGMTGICKAWVNFNGTSTVAIRDSFNVSSITDNGTGDYTVNFTTALPNANYSAIGVCSNASGTASTGSINMFSTSAIAQQAPTTSAFRFVTPQYNWAAQLDPQYVCVAVFSS